MTSFALLVSLLIPHADAGAIAAVWEARETNLQSVDISWETVRTSSDETFGFGTQESSRQPSTLRISGRKVREDGERLTAVMRDGRTRPAESDPDKARRQFRHVLLEERLAGIQTAPFVETITSVSTIGGARPSRRFGLLEQMLFDVPTWCARPLSLLPGRSVVFDDVETSRQTHHVSLSTKLAGGQTRTVWVEPAFPHRILRVTTVDPDRATTQADLQYVSADELFPSSWTVQQLNSAGLPLDFMEVERTGMSINPVIDESVFQASVQKTSDDAALPSQAALTLRRFLRAAVDASPIALVALWGIVVIVALRRRRSGHPISKEQVSAAPLPTRGKSIALCLAIATPLILMLPRLPVFDLSMQEAYHCLDSIHEQASSRPDLVSASPTATKASREQSLKELTDLAAEIRRANEHRSGPWSLIRKTEPQEESAWRDILRVADSELPTLIRSSATNEAREKAVRLTLEKVDDHLAGVHPYMPPPKPVLIQTGLDKSAPAGDFTSSSRSAIILVVEAACILAGWLIWRSRRIRRTGVPQDSTGT